ncbi:hypothetical protein [Neotamlana laminarinivorans]|uniref:Uncharacterized protein n=1 Tax=Neotamlana laminarinivorans TaxID=2883124 RepID=A0A9X1L302_9FLAO|nr:hypothetical protein [Tamlana laminarinivorans]MCB4800325.1 hypothetical protein [Tamlana laminarinivorans]
MKKNIFALILLFVTFNLFSQDIIGKKSTKPNYSENSKIRVVYKEKLNKFHSNKKPAGIFVNGIFVGDENVLNVINSEKIESLNIEKENFEKNGKQYYGKILVKMKSEYNPKFITLKELIVKYLDLDKKPIVFQINEDVINQDYNEYLIDENFILKIILEKIQTTEKSTEINIVKLITKTTENIKKANTIRIKGTEI